MTLFSIIIEPSIDHFKEANILDKLDYGEMYHVLEMRHAHLVNLVFKFTNSDIQYYPTNVSQAMMDLRNEFVFTSDKRNHVFELSGYSLARVSYVGSVVYFEDISAHGNGKRIGSVKVSSYLSEIIQAYSKLMGYYCHIISNGEDTA